MAFQEYKSTESLNSMTTRQLRLYVSQKGTEAQKRLDSMNLADQSEALKDSVHFITKGTNSRVYKGTSNLTKSEMLEMAHQLQIFNRLDTESTYAQDEEYNLNKNRYETFVNNRKKDAYWKKFIDEDGNISKEGYLEYKQYINFVKEISEVSQYYSYKTLLSKATKQLKSDEKVGQRLDKMGDMLNKIYTENKGNGLTSKDLTEKFFDEWIAYEEEQGLKKTISGTSTKGKPEKYKPRSVSKVKTKKKKSSSNVKVKTAGNMKPHAKVHK